MAIVALYWNTIHRVLRVRPCFMDRQASWVTQDLVVGVLPIQVPRAPRVLRVRLASQWMAPQVPLESAPQVPRAN